MVCCLLRTKAPARDQAIIKSNYDHQIIEIEPLVAASTNYGQQ